jgi:hypothetical protein
MHLLPQCPNAKSINFNFDTNRMEREDDSRGNPELVVGETMIGGKLRPTVFIVRLRYVQDCHS